MTTPQLYNYDFFHVADGHVSWANKILKFGDAYASLCYAFGISWQDMVTHFKFGGRDARVESTEYTIQDQIDFLEQNKTRTPTKILEIGGGRGEVSNVMKKMGIPCDSVEFGEGAFAWYLETGCNYFGADFESTTPINESIEDAIKHLDLSSYDTIIMVESLEHIPEDNFNSTENKIFEEFHGLFIVVNWKSYHPINIGSFAAPHIHCRVVDDALYEKWIAQSKSCVYRDGSHLVIDI